MKIQSWYEMRSRWNIFLFLTVSLVIIHQPWQMTRAPVAKPSPFVQTKRTDQLRAAWESRGQAEEMEAGAFLCTSKCSHKSEGFEGMDDRANSLRNTGATV